MSMTPAISMDVLASSSTLAPFVNKLPAELMIAASVPVCVVPPMIN